MKLPDFINFEPLNQLRKQMNAELGDFTAIVNETTLTIAELEILASEGKDLFLNDIRVLDDGTLAYKDRRVVVYIRDKNAYGRTDELSAPKFHICNCRTLQDAREAKRYERYVAAIRQDGWFVVRFKSWTRSWQTQEMQLDVCQNCLHKLAFDEFRLGLERSSRLQIMKSFSLAAFFSRYPLNISPEKPKYTSITAPSNDYPPDWKEISLQIRAERKWICEGVNCGKNFSAFHLRRQLDVHHINGNKFDCQPSNLKALCKSCHANEPFHGHMKNLKRG